MDYHDLRHLADSLGLVYLMLVFVGAVLFAFRPGARDAHRDAARIPLDRD
jgi:cytochrome c oxidase cbb3-type subunit 4